MNIRELLDEATLSILDNLAHRPPVLVVVAGAPLVTSLASEYIARRVLPSRNAQLTDTHVVAPDQSTWTLEQVTERIITPTTLTPSVRNVIIVENADAMSTACAEHLLKAVEEPATPTTFLLCVSEVDGLLATIRGRAQWVLNLHVPSSTIVSYLESHAIDPITATRAVELLGADATLLAQLANESDLVERFLTAASTTPDPASAATSALDVAALVSRLVAASDDVDPLASDATDTKKSQSAITQRRRERRIAAVLINAWRTSVLHDFAATSDQISRCAALLSSLAAAEEILERNGQVATALAAASS